MVYTISCSCGCHKCWNICGVIKQNQSEVGHIKFSDSYWIVKAFAKLLLAENPIEIEQPVQ